MIQCMLMALLSLAALFDLENQKIPNRLIVGIILLSFIKYSGSIITQPDGLPLLLRRLFKASLFLLARLAVLAAVIRAALWIKPGSLGGGDRKFLMSFAFLFPLHRCLIALLLGFGTAFFTALFLRKDKVPLGPFLSLGSGILLAAGY